MHFDERQCRKKLYGYTASKAQLSTKSTISRAKAEVTEASFSTQARTILLQPSLRPAGRWPPRLCVRLSWLKGRQAGRQIGRRKQIGWKDLWFSSGYGWFRTACFCFFRAGATLEVFNLNTVSYIRYLPYPRQ